MRSVAAQINHQTIDSLRPTDRRASAITEYALLLAVISCSVLFGAG